MAYTLGSGRKDEPVYPDEAPKNHLHDIHHSTDTCIDEEECREADHWFDASGTCCMSTCPQFTHEPKKLYKVVISRDLAVALDISIPFELFLELKSPIVFYTELTDLEAIDIAERNNDIELSRAKSDWSI